MASSPGANDIEDTRLIIVRFNDIDAQVYVDYRTVLYHDIIQDPHRILRRLGHRAVVVLIKLIALQASIRYHWHVWFTP